MKMNKLISVAVLATSVTAMSVQADDLMDKAKKAGLTPIPESTTELMKLIDDPKDPITDAKVELGKKLFFDPRLSRSGLISCNTCHNLAMGGDDGVPAAIGHGWVANPHHLNSPTVYNSVFYTAQFWDGRSPHLSDQAQGPIQAVPEMAAPANLVKERILSIPAYIAEFKGAYGNDVNITFPKIADTIATFEKTLVTPSPFDDYLNGDENALTDAEKKGLNTFIDKGCSSCHTGIAIGGTMQPFAQAAKYKFAHIGDFKGDERGFVKTPTLRNITETAPYFHNGAIWTLEEAIKEMGSTQLGIKISDKDAADIKTFLGALKGRKPTIIYPQLPEESDSTPRPTFD